MSFHSDDDQQLQHLSVSWASRDPRTSSTQSLVQLATSTDSANRRLLLIWIHGYMGSEVSFKNFPAHVHNAVIQKLRAEGINTHVVHTKIYPRYESRNRIQAARDKFSEWLAPHEDSTTDVVLLGHSLGGIIAGDVALKPASAGDRRLYRHRLLGTINFDTPFLGLHPGIITTGIASLFRPAPKPVSPKPLQVDNPEQVYETDRIGSDTSLALSQSSSLTLPTDDPNYNPPYENDVTKPVRNGIASALHFISKHSDNLVHATIHRMDSQMQFAACVTDHGALRNRYSALLALDKASSRGGLGVRFVNYYTACFGLPKRPKSSDSRKEGDLSPSLKDGRRKSLEQSESLQLPVSTGTTPSGSPRISIEVVEDDEDGNENAWSDQKALNLGDLSLSETSLPSQIHLSTPETARQPDSSSTGDFQDQSFSQICTPIPPQSHESSTDSHVTDIPKPSRPPPLPPRKIPLDSNIPLATPQDSNLPPLPPLPESPAPFDPSSYPDKAIRKLLEKEHARTMKAHAHMVKDYNQAVKKRDQFIQKEQKKKVKATKEKKKSESEQIEDDPKNSDSNHENRLMTSENDSCVVMDEKPEDQRRREKKDKKLQKDSEKQTKKKETKTKDRKFCALPPKLSDGSRDPRWVRVFMEGMDEVTAHCALFEMDQPAPPLSSAASASPHYSGDQVGADADRDAHTNNRRQTQRPPSSTSIHASASEDTAEGITEAEIGREIEDRYKGNAEQRDQGRYVWLVGDVSGRICEWLAAAAASTSTHTPASASGSASTYPSY